MADLHPDPDLVETLRAKLIDREGGWLRKYGADAYAVGYMHGWTVNAATEHSAECDRDECNTCANLVRALSLFAAYSIEFPPDAKTMRKLYGP